jgi:hypothetical protein
MYLSSNFILLQIISAVDTVIWCITLRVLEKGVLQGILGSKRKEVTGGWRKRHNEKPDQFASFATYYWGVAPTGLTFRNFSFCLNCFYALYLSQNKQQILPHTS